MTTDEGEKNPKKSDDGREIFGKTFQVQYVLEFDFRIVEINNPLK